MDNPFESFATQVDEQEVDGERVIDFDIDANTGYEIQSAAVVDKDDRVKEAAVRFGRVEEHEDIGVGRSIIGRAFQNKVGETPVGEKEPVVADMSDFGHNVPHLRVERENIEEFGMEAPTLDEFAESVEETAEFTNNILRGDKETIDREIDNFL